MGIVPENEYLMGHEGAGIVKRVGEGATDSQGRRPRRCHVDWYLREPHPGSSRANASHFRQLVVRGKADH